MRGALLVGILVTVAVSSIAGAGVREDRLLQAVQADNHAAVQSLLAHHADPNAPLRDKSSVLAWAVHRQDEESVRLLLKAGAKPNALDIDGASPFMLACELGGPAIVSDLLKAGADAKATRPDGVLDRKPARRAAPSTTNDAVLVAKSETRKRVSKR